MTKREKWLIRFTILAIVLISITTITETLAQRGRYNYGLWNSGFRLKDPGADQLVMWDDSAGLLKFVDSSVSLDFYYVADGGGIGISSSDERIIFNSAGNITISGASLHFTAGSGTILGQWDAGILVMAAGDATNDGANVQLFGATHATNADDVRFRAGSTLHVEIDGSTGDLLVENDIVDLTSTDIIYVLKTVNKTIDLNDDGSTDDFQFDDDAANSTAQNVDMGAIIPAFAEVVSVQVRCFETVGAGTFQVTLGTASAGAELLAQATLDAANEMDGTATGAGPKLEATNAAKNVWIQGDPSGNWADAGDAGRWIVLVTYIDYGAAYTQKNP